MIKPPPLPTPTIVDGRSLYTSGDMREYAKKKYVQALIAREKELERGRGQEK